MKTINSLILPKEFEENCKETPTIIASCDQLKKCLTHTHTYTHTYV